MLLQVKYHNAVLTALQEHPYSLDLLVEQFEVLCTAFHRLQDKAFGVFAVTSCSDLGQTVMIEDEVHTYIIEALSKPAQLTSTTLKYGCLTLANLAEG